MMILMRDDNATHNDERWWLMDLARGFLVLLVIVGHTIHFFYNGQGFLLPAIGYLSNLIGFVGFVFVSGAIRGYVSAEKKPKNKFNLRILSYLLGYYLLAIWIAWLKHDLSWLSAWQILTWQKLMPFSEFLVPLIAFGAIRYPWNKYLKQISSNLSSTLSWGLGIFVLGRWLMSLNWPEVIAPWKLVLVGSQGSFSFPITSYLIVYLLGIWYAQQLFPLKSGTAVWQAKLLLAWKLRLTDWKTNLLAGELQIQHRYLKRWLLIWRNKLNLNLKIFCWLILFTLLTWIWGGLWNIKPAVVFYRWPPTLGFLLASLSGTMLIAETINRLKLFKNMPWTKNFFLLMGQNAFAVFVSNTFLMISYEATGWPKFSSAWLILAILAYGIILSIYIAKFLPINMKWGLTLISDCPLWASDCAQANEPGWVKKTKRLILKIADHRHTFVIEIAGHKIRLLKKRQLVLGLVLVMLAVTTLGVADNYSQVRSEAGGLSGKLNRTWVLVGDDQSLRYAIKLPIDWHTDSVAVKLKDTAGLVDYEFDANYDKKINEWIADIPDLKLEAGIYNLWAEINLFGVNYPSARSELKISEPLLVTWTIDWEGYDVYDGYLKAMEKLANKYEVPMTHMFNPRIFITAHRKFNDLRIAVDGSSEAVDLYNNSTALKDVTTKLRADYLATWVRTRHQSYGDQIGLHLHMFPDVAIDAGIIPKFEPTWGGGWTDGYDVLTTAYNQKDMETVLRRAIAWFNSQDLGVPTAYRAGGWFANLETLKALDELGFKIDSSGRTSYVFGTKRIMGTWSLEPDAQPYYPSYEDQNHDYPPPNLELLEIPNNGADSYAFTAQQMKARFDLLFNGDPLMTPKQITYLSHPQWFDFIKQQKMEQVFEYLSQYSYDKGSGPVKFVTLDDVYEKLK